MDDEYGGPGWDYDSDEWATEQVLGRLGHD